MSASAEPTAELRICSRCGLHYTEQELPPGAAGLWYRTCPRCHLHEPPEEPAA